MTSTTLDTAVGTSTTAAPTLLDKARAAVAARAAAFVAERRAVRAYRAQERAFAAALPGELHDLHSLARRG
jgi:hypothetical protein